MELLKHVVVNGLSGAFLGAFLIGVFAFLVAGSEGILNGLIFGGAFGLMMGISITGFAGGAYWWTGFFNRYGEAEHRKQNKEEES